MGIVPEDHGANQTEWISEYRGNGEQVYSTDIRGLANVYPYPWQLIHRVDLHSGLRDLATSSAGKGAPATLYTRSKVDSVDIGAPSITLEDGSVHSGDLVIAADGIHSKIRTQLVKVPPPEPSGTSAFQFLIPVKDVRADPNTAHFVEKKGEMLLLYNEDRRIIVYPCRNNTLLSFVAMHPDEENEAGADDWNLSASKESMLRCYTIYPEDVQAMLAKVAPDGINLWKLLDHEELGKENWVHGKVALLANAGHDFLPDQGQGGAQAIEDSAAFGALFPLGTLPSDIPRRLELYVQTRHDRATKVQESTRRSVFKNARGKPCGKVQDPVQFTDANFSHDAFDHAHGILLRDLNKSALYRRMPLSFGPSPGPRQALNGRARSPGKPTYHTSYVTFKTHKSYLSTLLPTEDFAITSQGSFATASLSFTKLGNLDWLGGRGYSMFGLYIHNVECKSPIGSMDQSQSPVSGDFLPVLFENKADPIITGREELGFSKVFATLEDTSASDSSFSLSAGWEGTEFCNFTLNGVAETSCGESVLQTPILHHKVIASSKERGMVDAEYTTLSPALPSMEGENRWKAKNAKIEWTDLEGGELEQAFPTLAHIIKGLRDMDVVEVLQCGAQASK
jgi:2-polyprenyl-6-methoxyphenol hydroxylase-like FAD-dependent oxidoreductase